jgi:hypothetical protein
MEPNDRDKRYCSRLKIEGATLCYKKVKLISFSPDYIDKNCPIIDLSRGGCRFLTQKPVKPETSLLIEINLPEEELPLFFYGQSKWFLPNPGYSYKYQVGIQFNAYGQDHRQNALSNLEIIKKIEQKCSDDQQI